MRYQARQLVMKDKIKPTLTAIDVEKILGKPRYSNDLYKIANMPGVAVGLAWTYVGGDILFIETSLSDGKGELKRKIFIYMSLKVQYRRMAQVPVLQ